MKELDDPQTRASLQDPALNISLAYRCAHHRIHLHPLSPSRRSGDS